MDLMATLALVRAAGARLGRFTLARGVEFR